MAQKVIVPRLGQTMTEGVVAKWHRQQDEKVKAGDPVYELEYDKATATIEAKVSGVLKQLVEAGVTVSVGEPVGVILQEGETLGDILAKKSYSVANSAKAASGRLYANDGVSVGPETQKKAGQSNQSLEKRNSKSQSADADVIVIGGGPGGYVSAIRLSLLGARVVLIEKETLGGTCLNRGCIPTKAILHSAELYTDFLEAGRFGIHAKSVSFDPFEINEHKKKTVGTLVNGIKGLLQARKVEVVEGTASLESTRVVCVKSSAGEKKRLTAGNIIIATGSVPAKPPIPGIDGRNVITSDEALELKAIPKSMAIIGGGVIGMEIGIIYASFGCAVTVLEAMPEILPGIDSEIARHYRRIAEKRMTIHSNATVMEITDKAGVKSLVFKTAGKEEEVEAEYVLVAAGRKPYTAGLHPDNAGVKTEKGRIIVNESFMTNIEGIYCIGDANGRSMLAHAASAQGIDVADRIIGRPVDGKRCVLIPSCVYTRPEIASVGKTEEQLKAEGAAYETCRFNFRANGRALTLGQSNGFVKILASEKYNEVLGVHIIGPLATEIINECTLAMRLECCLEEIAATIHAHPTVAEAVMEAAEAGLLGAIHSL